MSDDTCNCPFPRDKCPACEHVCRACRLGLRAENERLKRERDRLGRHLAEVVLACEQNQTVTAMNIARRALTNTTPPPAAERDCVRCKDLPARVCLTCYSRGVHDARKDADAEVAAGPPVALRPARLTPQQIAQMVAPNFEFQKGSKAEWFVYHAAEMAAKHAYIEADRTQRTCCAKAFAEGRDGALANAAMKAYDMGHPDVRKAINRLMPDGSPAIPIDDERYAAAQPRGGKL